MALALPSLLTSCGNDDDYSAGPDVVANCPAVYFSSDNSSALVVSNKDSAVTIKVKRAVTTGEITVPIVVESKVGDLSIPSSVTFADGEDEADLTVGFSNYKSGMTFTLSIDDAYVNPYLKVEGSSSYTGTLTQVNWVCDVAYDQNSRFKSVTGSAIYQYEGINRFVWRNFLGSGVDLTFMVDTSHNGTTFDPNDVKSLKGDFIPLDHFYKDEWGYRFVQKDSNDDYVTWTPEGQTEEVTSFYFYFYQSDYSYSSIDFGTATYGYPWGMFAYAAVNDTYSETIYYYLYY